ncbi:DHA2 family efflux MFS transporter permease subunit [Gordonia amarae]|uniref:DHA2 family efflux MFS transporter permease subunit n=1 Tax=Gordonia amarae TaxID=36821 RepID=A0A857MFH9_9ACTN|nr:MFS transporter [Gordonia amarae]QHN19099.1 DHA2 family efflux MFS transporter permease subunit [Gordonia amarae]QHN23575.1 DHA2 family efflux MFS transporter permease subunit [Gordonia amarae]QHN32475.1 DHA2 family efflux MFS transporter permease subunit [Gordonia amarae]QHN41223.1 DHA2 family efflux MFS transporter permease subunit [Gordonia amarae]
MQPTTSRWLALAALCFSELLVGVDNSIVNVALPTMARDLGAGISGLQWIVDAYTLVFAGLLLTGGYLGDRFGHRRMLLTGIAGFAGVSILAGFAGSLGQLIAARAGLGVFAALVFPATLAIVTAIFTKPSERAAAVGIWAATSGVSVAIGPVLGGWLLEHFSWSSVFWVNVPLAVVAAAVVLLAVRPTAAVSVSRFDTTGLILSIIGIGLLTYTMIEAPHFGWTDARTIGGLAVAAAVVALFVRRELATAHPILDVRLFTNRYFATAAAMISVAFFALFGFIFLITQYFQAVKGYGPLESGLRTLPFAIVMAVFSPIAMSLSHRFGPRLVTVTGALSFSAGFALVEFATPDSGYWTLIIEAMTLMAVGLAFISGPCTQMIVDALSPEQAGAGSAVNDTTRELGGTLGVAVLGSVLTSVYASTVGDRLTGLGVPAGPVHIAQDSVMTGVEVARQSPEPVSAGLEDIVRRVFVDGLHSAVWVAVAVTAGAAVAAVGLLRGAPRGRDSSTADSDPKAADLAVPKAADLAG